MHRLITQDEIGKMCGDEQFTIRNVSVEPIGGHQRLVLHVDYHGENRSIVLTPELYQSLSEVLGRDDTIEAWFERAKKLN